MNLSASSREGSWEYAVPMARWTTWRVGGIATRVYIPASSTDLQGFLVSGEAVPPLLWIGRGSNLLVREGGLTGTVIASRRGLQTTEWLGANWVRAEAGVSTARLARFCARHGLAGAEFLAGIPGTVGGALAMNAGAYGSEVADIVRLCETIDRNGCVRCHDPVQFEFSYRQARLPADHWFLAAHFALSPGDTQTIQALTKRYLEHRRRTQPIHLANAGSVFRNPPGDYAARLIEAAGLKGVGMGAARISTQHANFIVNRGGARASDIETLIQYIQDRIEVVTGVWLEPEVCIVGQSGA